MRQRRCPLLTHIFEPGCVRQPMDAVASIAGHFRFFLLFHAFNLNYIFFAHKVGEVKNTFLKNGIKSLSGNTLPH